MFTATPNAKEMHGSSIGDPQVNPHIDAKGGSPTGGHTARRINTAMVLRLTTSRAMDEFGVYMRGAVGLRRGQMQRR